MTPVPFPFVLGLCGKAGAGKSWVGAELGMRIRACGWAVTNKAFAAPLKDAAQMLFGLTHAQVAGTPDDKMAPDLFWESRLGEPWSSGRRIMQSMGTELIRTHVHPDFWCWRMERWVRHLPEPQFPDVIIVDDVRFPNEAEWVRKHGLLVRVIAPASNMTIEAMAHLSEAHELTSEHSIRNKSDATEMDLKAIVNLVHHAIADREETKP